MSAPPESTAATPATERPGARPPRFAIVVPAYNAAGTLAETLDGIVAQSFPDWECAVVDDGSTDSTPEIASRYAAAEPRIRLIRQENQGTGGAYNTGVLGTTGEFIVLCSADDVLLPDHLARMSAFIDAEGGYDIYSSNGYRWLPDGSRRLAYRDARNQGVHSRSLAEVIEACFYSVGATYRRELFTAAGGYRPRVFGEDYDFWLRAMARGARHRYLPEPLSLFRESATQKSADKVKAFHSDMRLVAELRSAHPLSAEERAAVRRTIRDRRRRIARLNPSHPLGLASLREKASHAVSRIVGRKRARRFMRRLRALVPGRR